MIKGPDHLGDDHGLDLRLCCGAEGTRTPDPLDANEVRYQLRYSPWNVDKANRHAPPGANQIPRRADRTAGRAATSADGSRASTGTRAVALRVRGGLAGCLPAGRVVLP